MKQVKTKCLVCGNAMTFKNYFSWVWNNLFHWFGKRLVKCTSCGARGYLKREK